MHDLALAPPVHRPVSAARAVCPVGVVGTGNVGGDLLNLLAERRPAGLALCGIANSRHMLLSPHGLDPEGIADRLVRHGEATDLSRLADHLTGLGPDAVIVDLTASTEVAARHVEWLQAGLTVVTANKWAASGTRAVHEQLRAVAGGRAYRHATTVGAGLPLLDSLHRLRAAGDRVYRVAGLFSGTLTYLMHGLAEGRAFSECLGEAHARGLTEPDPRLDLSGLDVARKLVISARAAGWDLALEQVDIESLVPAEVEALDREAFLASAGPELDAAWQRRLSRDARPRCVPRYVGEVDEYGMARVGIRWLPADHPFVNVGATDNVFEIRSDSYDTTPMIIRGPGAGARVTAVQVLSDVLACRAGDWAA